jgi:hypothetical protein
VYAVKNLPSKETGKWQDTWAWPDLDLTFFFY